ncbi:MAG: carboxylating nicotinate-nucleotide diphosphorylase [Bacteroidetes bacterium]|nr:carboxylating nicotinate-nucleotide diphosphorylase [Bacteroidota bacterium]
MSKNNFSREELNTFIDNALHEDVRDGDHTSNACIPVEALGRAQLLIKESGMLAGVELAELIFERVDPKLDITILRNDGEEVSFGTIAFYVEGSTRSILKAERLVLNCMQRMSGIATLTSEFVKMLEGTKAKVIDTRKTTPGFRLLEKMAVKIGGGTNHRSGLYDMIMIKNNHIDYCGGIPQAISSTKDYLNKNNLELPIEVEARNLDEVQQILNEGKIDRIMLDNFSIDDTQMAVELIDHQYKIESSGNIDKSTIESYAKCGVDFISVGALTHSYTSLDLSLRAE